MDNAQLVSTPSAEVNEHMRVKAALDAADKPRLIHALRGLVTAAAWEQSEDDLRFALANIAETTGAVAVISALSEGA